MTKKASVLLASRSAETLQRLSAALAPAPNLTIRTRQLGPVEASGLPSDLPATDVLVVHLSADDVPEAMRWLDAGLGARAPMIVVGPAGNADAVRMAVRNRARDFLPESSAASELASAVQRVLDEPLVERSGPVRPDLTVVTGAAGGVGTSFIACSLAHASVAEAGMPTLLMDLDVNDAPLASYLDLEPERGLLDAIAEIKFLDEHALAGYVTRHASGLHLLGAPSRTLASTRSIERAQFATLMEVVQRRYRHVVVDALHGLDGIGPMPLAAATNVVVVVQQSVAQLRQAARLLRILNGELGVPDEHVFVVVNRYSRHSTVGLDDVRRTLGRVHVSTVPNHYQTVLASIDGGVPVSEIDRSSAVVKAVVELQHKISGTSAVKHKSLLQRALPAFLGG